MDRTFPDELAALHALADTLRIADSHLSSLTLAEDRGYLEGDIKAQFADAIARKTAALAAVDAAITSISGQHRVEWAAYMEDTRKRLHIVANSKESDRFAAGGALQGVERLMPAVRASPDDDAAVRFARGLPILKEHRRMLDVVMRGKR